MRRRVGVGVADHARRPRSRPCAATRAAGPGASRACGDGVAAARGCGTTTMKRCGAPRRRAPPGAWSAPGWPPSGWRARASRRTAGRRPTRSTTTCSTGRPVSSRRRSRRSRRSQPEDSEGSVETMISSMPCSAIASLAAFSGSPSPTSPVPEMPSSLHELERQVDAHLGAVAHRVVVDHVAVAGPRLRDHDVEGHVVAAAWRARARRRAACAPPIVSFASTRTFGIA